MKVVLHPAVLLSIYVSLLPPEPLDFSQVSDALKERNTLLRSYGLEWVDSSAFVMVQQGVDVRAPIIFRVVDENKFLLFQVAYPEAVIGTF